MGHGKKFALSNVKEIEKVQDDKLKKLEKIKTDFSLGNKLSGVLGDDKRSKNIDKLSSDLKKYWNELKKLYNDDVVEKAEEEKARIIIIAVLRLNVDGDGKKILNIRDSCKKIGIDFSSFYKALKKFPSLKDEFDQMREIKRLEKQMMSEDRISEVLNGDTKLGEDKVLDAAKFVAKNTMSEYNVANKVETQTTNLNFDLSINDLQEKLKVITNLD